jgi:hypothetical protein
MKQLNLSMVGNLIAIFMVGVAVWMGTQWRPNPNVDWMSMKAIALAFCGGLLTALSSQVAITMHVDNQLCPVCGQKRKDATDGDKDK